MSDTPGLTDQQTKTALKAQAYLRSHDSVGELEVLQDSSAGRVLRMSLSNISPAGEVGEKEKEAGDLPFRPSSSLINGGVSIAPDVCHTPLSVPELSSVTPGTVYFILRSSSYIKR